MEANKYLLIWKRNMSCVIYGNEKNYIYHCIEGPVIK